MGETSETVPDWVMWGASDGASGFMTVGFVNHLVAGSVDVQTVTPETVYPYGPDVPITETGPDRIVGADLKFRAESPPDSPDRLMGFVYGEDYTSALENILQPVGSGQMNPTGFLKVVCDEVATARSLICKLDEEGALRPSGFTEAEHVLLEKCQPRDES